jgi:predicted nucleotidyltransferase
MSGAPTTFDSDQLRALLSRVGALAVIRGVDLQLTTVGGAAVALLFGTRRVTRDIDVVEVQPSREILDEIATAIAHEEGLPARWLSDEAARFVRVVSKGPLLFEGPGIRVHAVSLEQLLASKLDAMRDDVDRLDAVIVAARLGLAQSSLELAIAPYLRPERYKRACDELEDIWQEVEDARG